jgi:DNA-binding transcriptional MocR family regulator
VAFVGSVGGVQLARLLGDWRLKTARPGRTPDYAALALAISGLLRDGRLHLGLRLPAERELADALSVSRTTVTATYRELRGSGYLTSRRGAGSWTELPADQRIATSGLWSPAADTDLIDLSCAALSAPDQLGAAAEEAVRDLPRYARGVGLHPTGLPALREAVASGYQARGLPTSAEQIMITSGAQHAADLTFRLSLAPGQAALVESPSYPNMIAGLRANRARLIACHLDPATGWDARAMLGALRSGRPALAYVIPEFHNPTGHAMSEALRERLPSTAHAAGTDVIVDESFVDLWFEAAALPPVAAFDRHARVLSIGGMTKPYWGGLRVGWIRAAAPVIARLTATRITVDTAGPVLDQLLAVHLLDRAQAIVPVRREQLRRQRDALVGALRTQIPQWTFRVPAGGVCLWAELDAPVSTALAHAALDQGVRLAPGPRFGVDGTLERYVRLPFTLPPDDLADAVRRLAVARTQLDHARPPEWASPALVA